MEYSRNHIITGGRGANPAIVSVNMEPMRLEKGMEIAVKSVAYGEIFNIHKGNNFFNVAIDIEVFERSLISTSEDELESEDEGADVTLSGSEEDEIKIHSPEMVDESEISYDLKEEGDARVRRKRVIKIYPNIQLKIPIGRYYDTKQIMQAILDELNKTVNFPDLPTHILRALKLGVLRETDEGDIIVLFPPILKVIHSDVGLFKVLNASVTEQLIAARQREIPPHTEMCFLYLNIVQNSFINGHRSRIACVFPVRSHVGYSNHEITNPSYIPIEVRQFSRVTCSLLDVKGEPLGISDEFDTVITLQMRHRSYK